MNLAVQNASMTDSSSMTEFAVFPNVPSSKTTSVNSVPKTISLESNNALQSTYTVPSTALMEFVKDVSSVTILRRMVIARRRNLEATTSMVKLYHADSHSPTMSILRHVALMGVSSSLILVARYAQNHTL